MKHLILSSLLILILLLIGSCASIYIIGEDFDERKVNSLVIGETNKSQVLELFGDPYEQGQINQFTVFTYSYEENKFPASSGGRLLIDKKYKSLMILFDENSNVKLFTHNVPLSFSSLEIMILNEVKSRQQENNPTYYPNTY